MTEHVADFEWRGEGDEAEVVLYAPNDSAFERVLPAARLPGVESPVYAAASESGFGWAVVSAESVAPDLASGPMRGVLLTTDAAVENLEVRPKDLRAMILRNLAEVGTPALGMAGVRRVCEGGALAVAEYGLIEAEDLALFGVRDGEPDALDRRAIAAGERDWEDRLGEMGVYVVGEVFDSEGAEEAGIEPDALAVEVRIGSGDLGRLASAAHRERILGRVWSGEFELDQALPVAPPGSGEAADLLAALRAAENFADGRAALFLYALRRALRDIGGGGVSPRASWSVGGIEEREGSFVHRRGLAAAGEGKVLVAGSSVATGTGKMWGSVPPFGTCENEGRWAWEEAGLLERLAGLSPPGG